MSQAEIPPEILHYLKSIKAKRAQTVITHILEHGYITTAELSDLYGYRHPPRAARDVREYGIPLETFNIKAEDGRTIGAYRFGDLSQLRPLGGRRNFPKAFKQNLIEKYGAVCAISGEILDENQLQIDHCIPYEISGDDAEERQTDDYMLLSPAANRQKSWACEHCHNWAQLKDPQICQTCYWAYPEKYEHVAMQPMRRVDIVWSGAEEIQNYEQLQEAAAQSNLTLQAYIKILIREWFKQNREG